MLLRYFLAEKPEQCVTGNAGYFGNAGSVADNSHKKNTAPRLDSTRRECRQSAHKPIRAESRWGDRRKEFHCLSRASSGSTLRGYHSGGECGEGACGRRLRVRNATTGAQTQRTDHRAAP